MKTVLVNPPWYRLMGRTPPGLPLGLACIAGALRGAGHEVTIVDGERVAAELVAASDGAQRAFFHDSPEYLRAMQPEAPLWSAMARLIMEQTPDIAAFTVWSGACPAALNCASALRRARHAPLLVAGGAHATLDPASLVRADGFDYVIRGEGEVTAVSLFSAYAKQDDPLRGGAPIPGTAYRAAGGALVDNGLSPLADTLEALPAPSYEGIIPPSTENPVAGIATSRGCPFQCGFCASKALWTARVRYRPVAAVIDEIASHHARYGLTEFRINDDSFCLKEDRVLEFCDRLEARFGRDMMHFWIDANECSLTPALIGRLERAGCRHIAIGIESVAPRIRREFIRKPIDLDHARELFAFMNSTRILSGAYFMTGWPQETEDELRLTFEWMQCVRPGNPLWGVLTPYPGTELFNHARAAGLLPNVGYECFMHHSLKTSMADIPAERHAELLRDINAASDALSAYHRARIARRERRAWIMDRLCHPLETGRKALRMLRKVLG